MPVKELLPAILLLAAASGARAIEVPISENIQRVGFVDMQRIWKSYPETINAKENFEDLMRQAEEQINMRKVEILHMRNDLSQMKSEREYLAKTAPTLAVATTTSTAPPAPAPVVPNAPPAYSTHTVTPHTLGPSAPPVVPLPPPPAATQPAATRPDIAQLPGLSLPEPKASTAAATTPAAPPAPAPGQPRTLEDLKRLHPPPVITNIPRVSTTAAAPPAPASPKADQLVINIPGVSTAPLVNLTPPSVAETAKSTAAVVQASTAAVVNPALAELDVKIALKERELTKKEADFKEFQEFTEKNLLDLEKRKSEILLGKIDKAIKAVARQYGIAIMQEKSSILMGSDAVDLTDQVIKYLQGIPLPSQP